MGNKAKQAEGKRVEEEAGIGDGGGGGGEWRVVFLMVSCRSALKLEPFLIIFSTISLTLSLSLSSPSILSLSLFFLSVPSVNLSIRLPCYLPVSITQPLSGTLLIHPLAFPCQSISTYLSPHLSAHLSISLCFSGTLYLPPSLSL